MVLEMIKIVFLIEILNIMNNIYNLYVCLCVYSLLLIIVVKVNYYIF